METVRGHIVDVAANRVRLENPDRNMRMWFELATNVDVSDPRLWLTNHDFDVIGAGND